MKKILAVDPSVVCTGLAFFEGSELKYYGKIKPKKKGVQRLQEIMFQFKGILEKYEPNVLVIESQYLAKKNNSVLKTRQVQGMFIGAFFSHRLEGELLEVYPTQAKKALGIETRLKRKEAKQEALKCCLQRYPNMKDLTDDIADAIGVGLHYIEGA